MYNVFLLVLPFIVLCVCVYLTIIDYKIGIVPNRYIFVLLCIDVVLQFFFLQLIGSLFSTILVVLILVFLSASLYFLDIWGAGDSKLISVIILSYPFPIWNCISSTILVALPILAFIFGYIHSIVKMIISLIKRRYRVSDLLKNLNLNDIILNLGFSGLVSIIIFLLFNKYVNLNFTLQLLVTFLISFAVRKLFQYKINVIFKENQRLIFSLYFLVLLAQYLLSMNVLAFSLILFLQLLLNILRYDSYKTVDISQLEKGMILSMSSRMLLEGAGVLTQNDRYESVADKLNEKNILRIKKWKEKNNFNLTVTVVNTVPFVSYIFLANLFVFIWVSYEFLCILQ